MREDFYTIRDFPLFSGLNVFELTGAKVKEMIRQLDSYLDMRFTDWEKFLKASDDYVALKRQLNAIPYEGMIAFHPIVAATKAHKYKNHPHKLIEYLVDGYEWHNNEWQYDIDKHGLPDLSITQMEGVL